MATILKLINEKNQFDAADIKSWQIHIQDLMLDCFIGIFPHEKLKKQPLKMNIKCDVEHPVPLDSDDISTIVCYDQLIQSVETLLGNRHTFLVETVCEDVANLCLQDHRIQKVWVRAEKTAVYPHVLSVGVEITREQKG